MNKINSYKDLIVWNKSIDLVQDVYKLCKEIPRCELFGLISQMQRSAVSITSNIAEGHGRSSRADYVRFLYISRGSLYELETQITLASKLYKVKNTEEIFSKMDSISKMISSLLSKLKN